MTYEKQTIAYADPPYLGQGKLYKNNHSEAHIWDDPETHRKLIESLERDYPDGWALSASSTSLRTILPMCPPEVRIHVWVKTFAAFKKHVNPAYAWEPIIVRSGRGRTDEMTYMRDWVAEPIALKKGLTGAKPPNVCYWLFDAMNMRPGDTLVDIFPGTGIVGEAWEEYQTNYIGLASRINRVSAKWEMGKGTIR